MPLEYLLVAPTNNEEKTALKQGSVHTIATDFARRDYDVRHYNIH